MKQNITLDQWQELSLSQQRKFQEVSQKGGLPTIGRMFEFLEEKGYDFDSDEYGYKHFIWDYSPKEKELCDALWNRVMEVL